MSTLNVDKVDPSSGTALELGTSGDTITVPTGAGLTVTDEVKTNKVSPATGTAFALGDSGDTFTVPSGATLDISAATLTPPATMPASSGINFTALNATNLGSGTVPTARLGSGTASSSTVLYGDQTYKAEPGGGKVLQVVTASFAGQVGTTSTSWAGTGITASITPAHADNKVLVMTDFCVNNSQADYGNFQSIFRGDADSGGTNLGPDATGLGRISGAAGLYHMCSMHILDSPSTTSAQAYETGFKNTTTSLASYTMINNITAKITLIEIDGT